MLAVFLLRSRLFWKFWLKHPLTFLSIRLSIHFPWVQYRWPCFVPQVMFHCILSEQYIMVQLLCCASAGVVKEAVTAVMYHTLIWHTQRCRVGLCLCECVSGRAGWESVLADLLPLSSCRVILVSTPIWSHPILCYSSLLQQARHPVWCHSARCGCENSINHILLVTLHQLFHKTICACWSHMSNTKAQYI